MYDGDTSDQVGTRSILHLCEFDPRSDTLHETQALRGAYETLGSKRPQLPQPRAEHRGSHTRFDDELRGLEGLMTMGHGS